jgi:chemotaxis methyl-accepting protein methylase
VNARDILARRMAQWTGFDLDRGGRATVLDKLIASRLKALGHTSADAYVASLSSPDDPEVVRLIEGLTVGHTWFFRDEQQTEAIAHLFRTSFASGRPSECWVAGCSTGEEAYTLAMLAESSGARVDFLATDINSESLDRARGAKYALRATRGVPAPLRSFLRPAGVQALNVDDRVRARVRFQRHNLIDPPPRPQSGDRWPLIVCRNVLIYFRGDVALAVLERLADALAPGGWLFLGASEVLRQAPAGFALVDVGGRVALRRSTDGQRAAPPPKVSPSVDFLEPRATALLENADTLLERALANVHEGKHAEAVGLCARALESDVLLAEAHLIGGIAFYMSDDPASAARALRSALLLDPDEWVASFYLALSYDQLGRKDEALRAYRNTDAASRTRRTPSRLLALDAWKDEIALLARARAARRGIE